MFKNSLLQLSNGLVELFFPQPQLCPTCLQENGIRGGLCKTCLGRITFIVPPICPNCGRLLRLAAGQNGLCHQCRQTKVFFSQSRAVALYEGALRDYLQELKYRYRPELGLALGMLLVEWIKVHSDYDKFDLIVPIPLHREKLLKRGYNQAELLAKPLQKYLGIALLGEILLRRKETESQNALDARQRFKNLSEAFEVSESALVSGKRILLIDDIMTTGATASEGARALLRAGAIEVKLLTLAAGAVDSDWF